MHDAQLSDLHNNPNTCQVQHKERHTSITDLQGSEKQSEVRIKKFMTMMDSMTEEELNTNDIKVLQQPTRIARISKGAGRHPQDYFELLGKHPSICFCYTCMLGTCDSSCHSDAG